MAKHRTALLALADPVLEGRVGELPGISLQMAGCETGEECLEQLEIHSADLVILSAALAPWPGALPMVCRAIQSRHPQCQVIVLADEEQVALPDLTQLSDLQITVVPPDGPVREGIIEAIRGGSRTPVGPGMPLPVFPPAPAAGERAPARDGGAIPARTGPVSGPAGGPGSQPGSAPGHVAPAGHPPQPASMQVLRQKVVALWGGKAGTGRSTAAVALADVLSGLPGVRVCTVDLNPFSSSLAPLLRKEDEANSWWSLSQCLMSGPLTRTAVGASLVPISPKWSLLTGPAGSEQWCGMLTPAVVSDIVEHLRADFDYILLDVPAGRSPVSDAAITLSQQVLLLVSAFFPDILDSARALEQVLQEGLIAREQCRLVLSQWVDSAGLSADDASAGVGLPAAARLPLAPAAALAAAREGVPVTKLHSQEAQKLADAVRGLAALVSEAPVGPTRRRGLFSRLG